MKKIILTLFIIFQVLCFQSFAQDIAGTYYAFDTRFLGGINGKQEIIITKENDKNWQLEYGNKWQLENVGNNQYQDDENTCQITLRSDGDLEVYFIKDGIIESVFLFTKNKAETKARWNKVKNTLKPKVDTKAENVLETMQNKTLSYYYNKEDYFFFKEPYNSTQEKIEISNETEKMRRIRAGSTNGARSLIFRNYTKIAENIYFCGYNFPRVSFMRYFPAENKMIVYENATSKIEDQNIFVAQLQQAPAKDQDKAKVEEFKKYVQNYISKYRIIFLGGFKNYTHAEAPLTKVQALFQEDFQDSYNVLKTKIISQNWKLIRNDFGRTLRRILFVLLYMKDKKTGECYIAFRYVVQEFDGSSYGNLISYQDSSYYYDLEDDKKNLLMRYGCKGLYDVPCAELTK